MRGARRPSTWAWGRTTTREGYELDAEGLMREVRVALTVEDFEGAVALYGWALGLRTLKEWEEPHGRGVIFAACGVTIEVIDRRQAEYIDEVEAGWRVSGPVRLALRVSDVDGASRSLRERGARAVGVPVETPWGDRNQRLRAPDSMQLTLLACD
jgi:catechol 2,3-dioxygenase-like lactoylglutathione lyase family enzyme